MRNFGKTFIAAAYLLNMEFAYDKVNFCGKKEVIDSYVQMVYYYLGW